MMASKPKPPESLAYSTVQYHCLPVTLIVTSEGGISSWNFSRRKEGMTIAKRIRTGTTVQTISIVVL